MNKELIIRTSSSGVDFALLKDGRLIELQQDEDDNKFARSEEHTSELQSPA